MTAILRTQVSREDNPLSLAHVAEPTATATALVLSHGVQLCGRPDLAQSAYELGEKFGSLVYLLDAVEDRERDAKTGAFNPMHAFPDLDARREILVRADEIAAKLPPALAKRLWANVEDSLGLRLPVMQVCGRISLRSRLRDAVAFAQSMRQREAAGIIKGAAVLATVALLAFVFPHHVRREPSRGSKASVFLSI